MDRNLIEKYAIAVPRYTSYPTAPHFHDGISNATYASWLSEIEPDASLSLYFHIPYCDRLCWFCGCHTKHTLRYEPIASYLKALFAEISWVGKQLNGRGTVKAVHLGGGSPTMLTPADMLALKAHLANYFSFHADAEISIEIDPNDLDEPRYDAMAAFGLTRASIGVQDFNPTVQKAINRIQTFEQTKAVVDAVRQRGVRSVNVDVLYGLPHQTLETIEQTIAQVHALDPDRTALFGYAHVPWLKKHQQMIDESVLPDNFARYEQAMLAADRLIETGMCAIGFDHFAKPGDTLALAQRESRLRRNFQGYTTDDADVLIGFGASAIGKLPQGYIQNITATGEYQKHVLAEGSAVARGYALDDDDLLRSAVIEALMCSFSFSHQDIANRFGETASSIFEEASDIARTDTDGLVFNDAAAFGLTERGKPFVRVIASKFDSYLGKGSARHSVAV